MLLITTLYYFSCLVNNVGVSHAHPMYFSEESDEAMESIVKVNDLATMKMTKLVLPQMTNRRKGLILNIGSFAGAFPTPFLQVYSGSKAFLSHWSISLGAELAKQGVHVELLNTYYVATNMSKIKKTSWLRPSPESYVKSALKTVGFDLFNTPHFSQDFYYFFMNMLPANLMLNTMTGIMEAGRAKALKRK